MFAIASSSGIVDDFKIYVGKRTLPPSKHELDISGDIVMWLIECIPQYDNYKVIVIIFIIYNQINLSILYNDIVLAFHGQLV